VASSTCEAEYMALALATKQWIRLTNALEVLNVGVTNAAMFWDNIATIDIAYNHKIGDRSKHMDVAYSLVCENIQSGLMSIVQVESAKNLADIGTKMRSVGNFTETLDSPYRCLMRGNVRFWMISSYIVIHCGYSFSIS
jgi:hypothetical protein